MIDPCHTLNQQQHCQTANGQPNQVFTQVGTGSPENAVTGLVVGLHQFWRTDGGGLLYIFNGTVGTKVGWDAV